MKLHIAVDHRSHEIEDLLINEILKTKNLEIVTSKLPHHSEDDYPDFAIEVLEQMDKTKDIGVVICGNGIGMSIIANKIKGVRCARAVNTDDCIKAREHNGANVLAIGTTTIEEMTNLITTFMDTPTPNEERHIRRMNKIINYENGTYNGL